MKSWIQRIESKGGMEIGVWWCFLLRISEIMPSQLPPIPPRQRAGVTVRMEPG